MGWLWILLIVVIAALLIWWWWPDAEADLDEGDLMEDEVGMVDSFEVLPVELSGPIVSVGIPA